MSASSSLASQLTFAAALVAASAVLGFHLGARSASARPPKPVELSAEATKALSASPETEGADDDADADDEVGDIPDGDLSAIKAGFMEPCKLVLIVRSDLKMTPGKITAQHATLACYKALAKANPKLVRHWEQTGQAKIALKATSENQILELEAIAKSLNLCARSIQDAGLTQVAEGSTTVLGIGPAPVQLINQVTGKLRLL